MEVRWYVYIKRYGSGRDQEFGIVWKEEEQLKLFGMELGRELCWVRQEGNWGDILIVFVLEMRLWTELELELVIDQRELSPSL